MRRSIPDLTAAELNQIKARQDVILKYGFPNPRPAPGSRRALDYYRPMNTEELRQLG